MALKPDPKDPNYKSEMERFKKDPEEWDPVLANPNYASDAHMHPPVRPANYQLAPLKQPQGREHSVERVRRKVLAHYGLEPVGLGVGEKSKPIAEALFAIAGEDEAKVNYDTDSARNMLRSAGLL